jgi:hypothetical protein
MHPTLRRRPPRSRPRVRIRPLVATLAVGAVLAVASPGTPGAGAQPATDLVILDLYPHLDHVHVGSFVRVTDRAGYDNQPVFLDHDRILFVSDRDGEATEVYRYTISTESLERLTRTPEEAEYSPRLVPGLGGADAEGASLVVVRVEADGTSQHLVRYPLEGGSRGERLLAPLDDIGYHAWGEGGWGVVFGVGADGAPSTLARVRVGEDGGADEVIAVREGVGRSLQPIPRSPEVSYVDLKDREEPVLYRLDPATGEETRVVTLPPGVEEHAWLSPVTAFFVHEGVLYRLTRDPTTPWIPMLTFREELGDALGGEVSRIAVSPQGLRVAVVVSRGGS